MRLLPNYENCFICGHVNKDGIHAQFYRKDNLVIAKCHFTEMHAGYKGIVHGGLISAVLDEALGRIASSIAGKMYMTGDLNIRFHNPLLTNTSVIVEAFVDEQQKHPKIFLASSGKMYDTNYKTVYASAKGRFFPIDEGKYQEILGTLQIEGEDRSLTMEDI